MATSREALKGYFETNKRPNEAEFEKLIDSAVHLDEDKASDVEAQSGSNTSKFITPHTARLVVETFAPVKTVNGIVPNPSGNVTITNVTGTASTITGEITQNQVMDLVGDLNSKQDALVSGSNIKTVNGFSIVGSGNVGFISLIGIPSSSFGLGLTASTPHNAFPTGCDEFTLSSNKTYLLKGKYIFSFTGVTTRITSMGWSAESGLNVQSIEYIANSFFTNGNNTSTATQNSIQISGLGVRKVIQNASAATSLVVEFEGVLRCLSGGKLIPKIEFTASPDSATMMVGSYIQLTEIGDNSIQTIGAVS